jgi:hypothetical protein
LPGARMSNVHASQQANVFRCGRNGEKGLWKVTVGAGIDLVVRSEPARRVQPHCCIVTCLLQVMDCR